MENRSKVEGSDIDVVISGMSGRFPECNNIAELQEKLYAGENMVRDHQSCLEQGLWGENPKMGKLKSLCNFDAQFFNISAAMANSMDPQARIIMEVVYEAILDAGVNPMNLRGSQTGVFIGMCFCDSEFYWFSGLHLFNKMGALNCIRSLIANRISYVFDFKGPSIIMDTACSSSLYALDKALSSLKNGSCDSAIVVGSNIILNPLNSSMLQLINATSTGGCCRSFDALADGYVRSEAIGAIFLQKSDIAHRNYAKIVHICTNTDGYKRKSLSYPSREMQKKLLLKTYKDAGVDPAMVDYVEAHGTGTKVGDPEELNALASVFLEGRNTPLLIGSIKSNIGHTEGASGVCSIIKALLAFKTQELPGNLHFKLPNPNVPALVDGRLKVVDKRCCRHLDLIGINSFGFGGSNAHLILRRPDMSFKSNNPCSSLPSIVCVSGCNQLAVQTLLSKIEEKPESTALQMLLREVYSTNINGHHFKGYILLNHDGSCLKEIQRCDVQNRPVWLIFSGLGSQWPSAGRALVQLPFLKNIINQCAEALQPFDLDLISILQDDDKDIITDHTKAFVAIVTIQVCLSSLLSLVGVQADHILGHSLGEIAAGFADGCLTAKQAVLSAYYRAQSVKGEQFQGGAMLSAAISAANAREIIPKDVDIACENSSNHITLSGPREKIKQIEEQLIQKGLFAKELETGGTAFHSRYIKSASTKLLEDMRKVISQPKLRSPRWISSSVPQEEWDNQLAKTCSAEYMTHNLVSPVLFADALSHVQNDALIVEIAPHGILQGVIRRVLPNTAVVTSTMKKDENSLLKFCITVGKLYLSGSKITVSELYPSPDYPVSVSTPMISPLVVWNHSKEWFVPQFSDKDWLNKHYYKYEIDLKKEEDAWYSGHKIDGRIIFPATGYLVLAWKTLATNKGKKPEDLPVVFQNVHFEKASIFPSTGKLTFSVELLLTTGHFTICQGEHTVATGQIFTAKNCAQELVKLNVVAEGIKDLCFPTVGMKDIYKDLHVHGYQYSDFFRGVLEVNDEGGRVCMCRNWTVLMDTVLQVALVHSSLDCWRLLLLPTRFRKVVLIPEMFNEVGDEISVTFDKTLKIIRSLGMQFSGVEVTATPHRPLTEKPLHLSQEFIPYHGFVTSTKMAINLCMQLATENFRSSEILEDYFSVVLNFYNKNQTHVAATEVLDDFPWVKTKLYMVNKNNTDPNISTKLNKSSVYMRSNIKDCDIIITDYVTTEDLHDLKEGSFIILITTSQMIPTELLLLSKIISSDGVFFIHLMQKKLPKVMSPTILSIKSDGNFNWIQQLKETMNDGETDIILLSQGQKLSGLIGLVRCLRKEPGGKRIRCLVLLDSDHLKFDPSNSFFKEQIHLGLVMNVFKNGQWGSYRYCPKTKEVALINTDHAYINIQRVGHISSLQWFQALSNTNSRDVQSVDKLFYIYYSALNFKDIMMATGLLPVNTLPKQLADQDCILGLEFAGKDKSGRRVMGIVPGQGLATTIKAENVFDVPQSWSLQEAATVPVAYSTAYYALIIRAQLKSSEIVLIHAGSGAVGQAAISIALSMACTVYTTVSTSNKKEMLCARFPQLQENNFAQSRNTSFEQHILRETQGRGVDVVLNSLTEDKLQASVRCLAEHGRFIEIGQYDIFMDRPLGLAVFLKNISFHGVRLDALLQMEKTDDYIRLRQLMNEGINNGVVRPLPREVFSKNEFVQAFRHLASGNHFGKVLLCIREEKLHEESKPEPLFIKAVPRVAFCEDMVCIVTGGLGGVGLQLSEWLVSRGLRQLVLTSRTGLCDGYRQLCLQRWRQKGTTVHVSTNDMCTKEGTRKILNLANKMGTVIGIFHLAVVMRDGLIQNQTPESFSDVWMSKLAGAYNLDLESRTLCPKLKYFVMFSSASVALGVPGQSSYAFANSSCERLVESRKEDGLPGIAVQWGPIADVGLAADLKFSSNVKHQSISSCMQELELFMLQSDLTVATCIITEKTAGTDVSDERNFKDSESLVANITNVLGITDVSKLPPNTTLASLGMDSLMQVEIRLCIEQYFGQILSAEQVQLLTVQNLLDYQQNRDSIQIYGQASISKSQMSKLADSEAMDKQFMLLNLNESPLVPEATLDLLSASTINSQNCVFFVHPIDGSCKLLREVATQSKLKAYGLQLSKNSPRTSIKDLATFYISKIREVQSSGPYTLIGYSVGAVISFEMCVQLEAAAETVHLIVLDFLPNPDKNSLMSILTLEIGILTQTVSYFEPSIDRNLLKSQLNAEANWDARLNHCLHIIGPKCPQDLRAALNNCYWLIKAVNEYKATREKVLSTPVLLVVAKGGIIKHRASDRYDFHQVTSGPVDVEYVEGNHITFLQGHQKSLDVANIIFSWMEKHRILQA